MGASLSIRFHVCTMARLVQSLEIPKCSHDRFAGPRYAHGRSRPQSRTRLTRRAIVHVEVARRSPRMSSRRLHRLPLEAGVKL